MAKIVNTALVYDCIPKSFTGKLGAAITQAQELGHDVEIQYKTTYVDQENIEYSALVIAKEPDKIPLYEFPVKLIKTLREKTGAGMLQCKDAFLNAGGDLDLAIEILRTKGNA